MDEIVITTPPGMKSCTGVPKLYILTGNADCLKRVFFKANFHGWLPKSLYENQIAIETLLSIDEVKEKVRSWVNQDVVKVIVE